MVVPHFDSLEEKRLYPSPEIVYRIPCRAENDVIMVTNQEIVVENKMS